MGVGVLQPVVLFGGVPHEAPRQVLGVGERPQGVEELLEDPRVAVARQLQGPQGQVVAGEPAHRSAHQATRDPTATAPLAAQGQIVDPQGEVEQLGCVLCFGIHRVGSGGPRRQGHEDRADPGDLGAPHVEAGAHDLGQGFVLHQIVGHQGPEIAQLDPRWYPVLEAIEPLGQPGTPHGCPPSIKVAAAWPNPAAVRIRP